MGILPTLRRRLTDDPPANAGYIDTPDMNYGNWLEATEGALTTDSLAGKKIAIVGAGVSGLCAAYHLKKAGASVTIYEATDRIGGRLYSYQGSSWGSDTTKVELGAMRFPPYEFCLNYYMKSLGLISSSNGISSLPGFPDPGTAGLKTIVSYQGTSQIWDGSGAPAGFETVYNGWVDFLDNGLYRYSGYNLAAPKVITEQLSQGDISGATENWQVYLDYFGSTSFYDAFWQIFSGANTKIGWHIPGGKAWTAEDFNKFGAIGVGSGGFGPLYDLSFPEFIRIVINGLETDQKFFSGGISELIDAFINKGNLLSDIQTSTPVAQIVSGDQEVSLSTFDNNIFLYDRVIVATTTSAMQSNLYIYNKNADLPTLAADTVTALNTVRLIPSIKVGARIAKFWDESDTPIRNLITDQLNWQIYTLDYGGSSNGTDTAACFITYTWEFGATKQEALAYSEAQSAASAAEIYKRLQTAALNDLADNGTVRNFINNLTPLNEDYETNVTYISWSEMPYFNGAFKLAKPGQDFWQQKLFFDFQKAGTSDDTYVYLAGDCVDWNSGWIEGGLRTAINAAAAVITSMGYSLNNPNTQVTPMTMNAGRYDYFSTNRVQDQSPPA